MEWREILIENGDDINFIWNGFHSKIQELETKFIPKIKIKKKENIMHSN